ncbi:MAG TPA: divalent-cation tolerance protein CutA [Trueperaceae bacterium]
MEDDQIYRRRAEGIVSVYMTFPDEPTAARIVAELLDERLIACANLLPGARSFYRWEGEVQDEVEVVAFAKTLEARLGRVVARVRDLHPYDTPCIVALAVAGGFGGYLEWVREEAAS